MEIETTGERLWNPGHPQQLYHTVYLVLWTSNTFSHAASASGWCDYQCRCSFKKDKEIDITAGLLDEASEEFTEELRDWLEPGSRIGFKWLSADRQSEGSEHTTRGIQTEQVIQKFQNNGET